MKLKAESIAFYDKFQRKLLSDYLYKNPRITAAIKFALRHTQASDKRILDFGCGIGWSSSEMAMLRSDSIVYGLDLSPNLIQTAQKLFGAKTNLRFLHGDFAQDDFSDIKDVDVFVFIDVFEHIHAADRSSLASFIKAKANASGAKIILTCPSPKHQRWLMNNKPEGLQPVDEIIDQTVLETFAESLNAKIVEYHQVDIWNPGDYFHCVLQINSNNGTSLQENLKSSLESQWSRLWRIRKVDRTLFNDFFLKRFKKNN